jgi:hypothetical protein
MTADATVTATIPTDAEAAAAAAALLPTTLLGTDAPAPTADQAAAAAALAAQAVADAKAATDATAAAAVKAAADALAAAGAPEKYEFVAPEGKTYDSNLLAAFEAGARDANMPQAAAQQLLDKMSPQMAERQAEAVTALKAGWAEASKSDKEFGGVNLDANLAIAKKGLDFIADPDLNKMLVSTGLGSHPTFIRAFLKVGQALAEDKFVAGSAQHMSQAKATSVLYDKTAT